MHSAGINRNRINAAKGGSNARGNAMLQVGGDVANALDLLDFIDDEEERAQMKIRYMLQYVVPLIKFPYVQMRRRRLRRP